MNLPKRLEELCKNTQADYGYAKLVPSETSKAFTAIEQDILELIGDNEYGNIGYVGEEMVDETTEEMHYRNQLRQELRTKLHKYVKGELTKGDN